MSVYLPDSTLLIDFARGERRAMEWFQSQLNSLQVVGCCTITINECLAGARVREREGWRTIFDTLTFWPMTVEDGFQSGIYRYDFARRGRQLQATDTLIAAVARRVGAAVVTANAKDFPMTDIEVIPFPRPS